VGGLGNWAGYYTTPDKQVRLLVVPGR